MHYEDKKKKVLEYIKEKADKEDWLLLAEPSIKQHFVSSDITKDEINNILIELKKKNIISKSLNFDVYIPKEGKFIYIKKLKKFRFSFFEWPYIISLFLCVSIVGAIFGALYAATPETGELLIGIFLLGFLIIVFGTIFLGRTIDFLAEIIFMKYPLIKSYSFVYIPMIIIGFVSFFIIRLWTWFKHVPLETGHIIAILSIAVLGGAAVATIIYMKKKE
ncbi:MAG: hypothetical protein ABIB43_00565 [archaeon]